MAEDYPGIRDCIRKAYTLKSVPEESMEVMIASLSQGSLKQYDIGLKRWWKFCSKNGIDPVSGAIQDVLGFLTLEYNHGATHGSLNSFRSAIALIHGPELGENSEIKRFFKGVSNLRPPKAKYDCTWDPGLVLECLKKWGCNENLSLEKLSIKLASSLALVTGHRMQTLSLIDIRNICTNGKNDIEIRIPDRIKTSALNNKQPLLSIPFYAKETLICPATTLRDYLKRTKQLREAESKLFISFRKPHKAVTAQTLSRWIKDVLKDSGVDTSIFSAYSTRHASTSAASRSGISIDCILKTAGWSEKSETFARFYKRELIKDKNAFALGVLNV